MTGSERRIRIRAYRSAFDLRVDVLHKALHRNGFEATVLEVKNALRETNDMEDAHRVLAYRHRQQATTASDRPAPPEMERQPPVNRDDVAADFRGREREVSPAPNATAHGSHSAFVRFVSWVKRFVLRRRL
jgi:hypothetical protein